MSQHEESANMNSRQTSSPMHKIMSQHKESANTNSRQTSSPMHKILDLQFHGERF